MGTNLSDGYGSGDGYEDQNDSYGDHHDSYGGDPVFYLTTSQLEELTGETGLPAGNYAVTGDMYDDEYSQGEGFVFELEPEQSESEDWEYAGGEEEDGYEIVGFSTEESLKGYFGDK